MSYTDIAKHIEEIYHNLLPQLAISQNPRKRTSGYRFSQTSLCSYQIRNSIRYVASKDQKEFMKDLKPVYQAISEEAAREQLDKLEEKWSKKYLTLINSWKKKWENLSNYFKYPGPIRKIIYTTNIIESVHRQFRKLTKTKGAFPNENSLLTPL